MTTQPEEGFELGSDEINDEPVDLVDEEKPGAAD